MSSDAKAFFEKWPSDLEKMKAMLPDTVRGFGTLFQAAMKDGSLCTKEKELIALGK